jgi:hypothetical protein
MSSTYPFKIAAAKAPADSTRQFAILAEVAGLDDYYKLFEEYGFGGDGPSWREHIETIIEEFDPDLRLCRWPGDGPRLYGPRAAAFRRFREVEKVL